MRHHVLTRPDKATSILIMSAHPNSRHPPTHHCPPHSPLSNCNHCTTPTKMFSTCRHPVSWPKTKEEDECCEASLPANLVNTTASSHLHRRRSSCMVNVELDHQANPRSSHRHRRREPPSPTSEGSLWMALLSGLMSSFKISSPCENMPVPAELLPCTTAPLPPASSQPSSCNTPPKSPPSLVSLQPKLDTTPTTGRSKRSVCSVHKLRASEPKAQEGPSMLDLWPQHANFVLLAVLVLCVVHFVMPSVNAQVQQQQRPLLGKFHSELAACSTGMALINSVVITGMSHPSVQEHVQLNGQFKFLSKLFFLSCTNEQNVAFLNFLFFAYRKWNIQFNYFSFSFFT